MTVVFAPPNTMPRIGSLWVYLSVDQHGNEGLCAAPMGPSGMLLPLLAADDVRLKQITPVAEAMAAATGMTITLVEFTERRELRSITGKSS